MANRTQQHAPDPALVLGKATLRAAGRMGISRDDLAAIIGRDRTSITRAGIDPESKSGELSALLVRCYRALAVMVDDNREQMREWLESPNRHTGGTPRDQLLTISGLVTVTEYLDAIRGKV